MRLRAGMAGAAMLALAGCGSASVTSTPVVTSSSAAAAKAATSTVPAVAHVGSTLALPDENVTVTKVIDPASGADQFTTAAAGKRFVGVELQIVDRSSSAGTGDADVNTTVIGSDDQTYTASFASIAGCTNFDDGSFTLAAGGSTTGCVTFELPASVKVAKVQYQPSAGFGGATGVWVNP